MPAKNARSKKKTGATRRQEQSSSKVSTVIISLLVAGFVGFLIYLDKIPTTADKQQPVAQKKEPKKSKPPKQQFDFYTVLPDREVKVADVKETKTQRNNTPKSPSQIKKTEQSTSTKTELKVKPGAMALYQLQVGAFKELSKADAMKARLAFLGVESNIQVIYSSGQKMYRVRVGPSTDSKKINQIKSQLKAQNINTFVQKLKG